MGSVASTAASGIGAVLGNVIAAPIKTVFGGNCENVCAGTWDIVCFIEHLCVTDIVKLVLVFCLAYITLLFVYLLFKLGLVQCIVKSLCKMGWAACATYWFAIGDITCFLWHKLKNTKRVYRGRRRRRFKDVEEGSSLSEDNDSDYYDDPSVSRLQRSVRVKRKEQMQRYPVSYRSRDRHISHSHNYDIGKKASHASVRLKGGSGRMRNPRKLQVRRSGSFKLHKRKRIKRRDSRSYTKSLQYNGNDM